MDGIFSESVIRRCMRGKKATEMFVGACMDEKFLQILRPMISAGVDINGVVGEDDWSALMSAMGSDNTEAVKILLGCNDIKLDIKDSTNACTALHIACLRNKVENVKIFLAHPSCSQDIVMMKTIDGMTAEGLAIVKGHKECARLIREFTAKDDRSVDSLVEFITGEDAEKKKKRKKRKKPVKSSESNDKSIHSDHTNPRNIKAELKEKIAEKRLHFDVHEQNVKDIIETMSHEIKNLISMTEKFQDEKNLKLHKVDKLDKELLELESKMIELKQKKKDLLEASKSDDKKIHECEEKRNKLEGDFEEQLKVNKGKGTAIKNEILSLEINLQEAEKPVKNLQTDHEPSFEPANEFLKFIDHTISEKEKELECPVCLEVACSPIFMCSEQHLICSSCRPKLSHCPECRGLYTGKPKRHRYAEKTAEELERLKDQKDKVQKYSSQ